MAAIRRRRDPTTRASTFRSFTYRRRRAKCSAKSTDSMRSDAPSSGRYSSNTMQVAVRAVVERRVPLWWYGLKGAIDVVVGFLLVIVTAPLVAVAARAIAAGTGGRPFFTQVRVGMNGRRF